LELRITLDPADPSAIIIRAHDPLRNADILTYLKRLRGDLMATLAQFQTALSEVDAETTRIGDYIAQLVAQLNRTDLTDAQEAEVLAALAAAGDRLKGIGQTVETPVPEGELPVLPA
jgi:hypothetical protein